MNKTDKTEITFEAALARLEEIVHALESGGAPLEQSLSLFEEGVGLVKHCNGMLESAEQKVKILMKTPDGGVEEKDFAADNKN